MSENRKCPVCGRVTETRFKPFCSKRCGDLDLGRWLKGAYAIPATENNEADETPGAADENAADKNEDGA